MGIIIEDTITLSNGLSASNVYCSFYGSEISLEKDRNNSSNYSLRGSACIWFNQLYRNESKPILDRVNVNVTITKSQLDTNVYTHLYTALKLKYTTTTNL
jgi:hypothetical protein